MSENKLSLAFRLSGNDKRAGRVTVLFCCGDKTRRLPLVAQSAKTQNGIVEYSNSFIPCDIFYNFKPADTSVSLILENGESLPFNSDTTRLGSDIKRDVKIVRGKLVISKALMNKRQGLQLKGLSAKKLMFVILTAFAGIYSRLYSIKHKVNKRTVTFMSGRRLDLSGNMKYVYDELKNVHGLEIKTLLFKQTSGYKMLGQLIPFLKLYLTSGVVVVDDYFRLLNTVKKPDEVKLFQLWHACGAFKTFGYSRLEKPGGPLQTDKNHRMYDVACVSGKEVSRHYAEGFGISDYCIAPTGVPRCDVFFDKEYKEKVRKAFFKEYPGLSGKRIILFAPTFRGNGQQSAYYPEDKIDINALSRFLGDDTAIIVKLHPFCREKLAIDKSRDNYIIDLSDKNELNDLLFVSDVLITDYSSAVFEASLLEIPMLFYAFDLEEYISDRDFYYDYPSFVPGKIVKTQKELAESIAAGDFESDKVKSFRDKFFDYTDGNSSQRVAKMICEALEVEYER